MNLLSQLASPFSLYSPSAGDAFITIPEPDDASDGNSQNVLNIANKPINNH